MSHSLPEFFSSSLSSLGVQRIGWVLVHSLWQFAVLAVVACLLGQLLRRGAATTRYRMLASLMLLLVLMPVTTWFAMPWPTDPAAVFSGAGARQSLDSEAASPVDVLPVEVLPQPDDSQWPMWGGSPARNNVSAAGDIPIDWNIKTGKNVKWTASLGTTSYGSPRYQSCSSPTIVNDLVLVCTAEGEGQPIVPSFLALNRHTGQVIWQDASPGTNLLGRQIQIVVEV